MNHAAPASDPAAAGPDAFARALAGERLHNGRVLNVVRLVGVTLYLGVVLWQGVLVMARGHRHCPAWLVAYWALSVAFFVGGRISDRLTRLSSLAIPFVDIPLVFLIQMVELQASVDPRAVANFTLGLYLLLLMAATMALRRWQVFLAAGVAIALQELLQYRAVEPTLGKVGGVVLLAVATGLCEHARRQRVRMVDLVCQERLLRERLGRYFSPQVAEHIQQQADNLATGQDRDVTVLFADLRGFTALSEQLGSARTVALLNEFHGRMVEAVFAHAGTLDKYMGDGLMAYFGAPVVQPDHPERAVRCGLDMQQRLSALNAERVKQGQVALRMGVGIHSGPVVLGSIGAPHRREFTVVGDTVNLASRLQQVCKLFDEGIIFSEATRDRLSDACPAKYLDVVTIRGKAAPVKVFTPQLRSPPASA